MRREHSDKYVFQSRLLMLKMLPGGELPGNWGWVMKEIQGLTQKERESVEHARQAQEQGLTLTQYAKTVGISIKALYQARRRVARKAALNTSGQIKSAARPSRTQTFVPVRVVPSGQESCDAKVGSPTLSCRVTHPSGWTIECSTLPSAAWVAAIMAGGPHAAP
jgi:DNA-binding CsgD family transcriptional regulator